MRRIVVPLILILAVASCATTAAGTPDTPGPDTTAAIIDTTRAATAPPPSTSAAPTPTTGAASDGEVCEADPGSPTDLDSEPADWARFGDYLPWTDTDGCLVRIDVISHIRGAEHCELQDAQFLTIGQMLGDSIQSPNATNRYVWDPDGLIREIPPGVTIDTSVLPPTATDTGYHRGPMELWMDPDDSGVIYVVTGATTEIWTRHATAGLCM